MQPALGALSGLILVRDEPGGLDGSFALITAVRAAQAQGLKVVFAAAADSPTHYEAALRKAAAAAGPAQRGAAPSSSLPPVSFVPLIRAQPDLWARDDGLEAARAAIQAAVEEAGSPETVCLVLDSLDALHDASPTPAAWRAFLASPACLSAPAGALVVKVSCAEAAWLPALTAAASIILTAAPLPSGAAAGVDGTLTLDRRAAAGLAPDASNAVSSPLGKSVFNFWAAPMGGVRLEERRPPASGRAGAAR